MLRKHNYVPTHRRQRSGRHLLTRVTAVLAFAASAIVAPLTTVGANAGVTVPVCGDNGGGCVRVLESLVPGGTDALIAGVETEALQLEQAVNACLNGSSPTCTSAMQEAQTLETTVVNSLTGCINAGCDSIQALVMQEVSEATALIHDCAGLLTNACSQVLDTMNSLVALTIVTVTSCADGTNATCNAAVNDAQAAESLVVNMVSGCLIQSAGSACATVVTLANQGAALAVALVESCGGLATLTCDQIVALVNSAAPLVQAAAYGCLNGIDATCYLVGSTVENAVYNAGLTAGSCLSDSSSTCGSKVGLAVGTVTDVEALVIDSAICAQDQSVCDLLRGVTDRQIDAPVGYDYADNSPTDLSIWDFTQPVPLVVSPDNTIINTTQTALDTAGSLTAHTGDQCKPTWHYDIDKGYGKHWSFVPGHEIASLNNTTNRDGTVRIAHDETKSISVTLSVSAEISVDAILATVKSTYGLSVTGSVQYTDTAGYEIAAAPHKTTYLAAGVKGWKTRGHYYHVNGSCMGDIDKGYQYAFTPSGDSSINSGYNAWYGPAAEKY